MVKTLYINKHYYLVMYKVILLGFFKDMGALLSTALAGATTFTLITWLKWQVICNLHQKLILILIRIVTQYWQTVKE